MTHQARVEKTAKKAKVSVAKLITLLTEQQRDLIEILGEDEAKEFTKHQLQLLMEEIMNEKKK